MGSKQGLEEAFQEKGLLPEPDLRAEPPRRGSRG